MRRLYFMGIILLFLITSCAKHAANPAQGTPGDYSYTLEHGGITRYYDVHIPSAYDGTKPMPAVIYLHGGGGNIQSAYKDGMDKESDKLGFILVSPAGTGILKTKILTWNAGYWSGGGCCGYALNHNIDDVGFISAMIDDLETKFAVDNKRIYATGISNGGMMSYRLGCELPEKIAAIAPDEPPAVPNGCAPKKPISVIHVQGTADPCTPYNGGEGGGCLPGAEKLITQSAKEMVDTWKTFNHCTGNPKTTYQKGETNCISFSCDAGTEVTLCTVQGGGHTWPSGNQYLPADKVGPVSYDISFDQMWTLLQAHHLD